MTLLRISTRFKMAQSEDTLRSIDNTFIYNLETLCRAGKSENTLRSIHNIFIYNLEHFAELGLLSELYFYLWFPTSFGCGFCLYWLWIALSHLAFIFSGVRWFLIQNCIFTYDSQQVFRPDHLLLVVNCFQNCIFTYDSQRHWISFKFRIRCELLSELYFYLWFPTLIDLKIWRSGCELLSELYFYLWFPTNTILLDF